MTDFQGQRCETCRYFFGGDGNQGLCRRYPPKVVAMLQGRTTNYDIKSQFPVMLKAGWCGEFSGPIR